MKTSKFVINLVVWIVIGLACGAFVAWYNTGDVEAARALASSTAWGQACAVVSLPGLEYAVGAVIGLLIVRIRNLHMSDLAKPRCFIISTLMLALLAAAVIPIVSLGPDSGTSMITVLAVYGSMYAPVVFFAGGILYTLGIAPRKQA